MSKMNKSHIGSSIVLGCAIGALALEIAVGIYRSNNLEPDAVKCSWYHNVRIINNSGLPFVRNKDMNNNGKCESVYFFKDNNGDISYKLITLDPKGDHIFSESKFYK